MLFTYDTNEIITKHNVRWRTDPTCQVWAYQSIKSIKELVSID